MAMPARDLERIEEQARDDNKEMVKEALSEWLDEHVEERRAIATEAISAWLDTQFNTLGRWTLSGFIAMLIAALGYYLVNHGGKP